MRLWVSSDHKETVVGNVWMQRDIGSLGEFGRESVGEKLDLAVVTSSVSLPPHTYPSRRLTTSTRDHRCSS